MPPTFVVVSKASPPVHSIYGMGTVACECFSGCYIGEEYWSEKFISCVLASEIRVKSCGTIWDSFFWQGFGHRDLAKAEAAVASRTVA